MSFTAPDADMLFVTTQRAEFDHPAGSHTCATQVPPRAVALEAAIRGDRDGEGDGEGALAPREDRF